MVGILIKADYLHLFKLLAIRNIKKNNYLA